MVLDTTVCPCLHTLHNNANAIQEVGRLHLSEDTFYCCFAHPVIKIHNLLPLPSQTFV